MKGSGRGASIFNAIKVQSILFWLVLLVQLPIAISQRSTLLSWFHIDDGFYYFVIARNIAHGLGVTFDGVTATNGFHPLWMLILTPVFGLPGKILPLRALAGLLVLLNAGTAALVCRLAARRLTPGAAFLTGLAFAFLPAIHTYTARGGMEVGLSVFLTVLTLDRLAAFNFDASRKVLALSLLACLTFLARLDHIFLAILIGLALLARSWQPPEGFSGGNSRWRTRQAALFYVPIAAVLLSYLVWSQVGFGTPTPVSGQVKRWWGTLENSVYGFPPRAWTNYIGQFVTNDPDVGPWSLLTGPLYASAETLVGEAVANRRIALAGIGALMAAAAGAVFWPNRRKMRRDARVLGILPLFLACLFQIAYYKFSGSVAQRPWYWINESLLLVMMGGLFLNGAFSLWARRGLPMSIPALMGVILTGALAAPHFGRLARILVPERPEPVSFYDRRSEWLDAHTAPGDVIAMTGTGSAAYFTDDRRFFNLDGLVNSYNYFQALQQGTALDVIAAAGVDYVFGDEYIIQVSDPYGDIFESRLEPAAAFPLGDRSLILWRFSAP